MKYTYQKITEQYQDPAGKWQVRVAISDTETIFLKFNNQPTEEEVKAEVGKYIANLDRQKETELERIDTQIEKLQDRKEILEKEISKP